MRKVFPIGAPLVYRGKPGISAEDGSDFSEEEDVTELEGGKGDELARDIISNIKSRLELTHEHLNYLAGMYSMQQYLIKMNIFKNSNADLIDSLSYLIIKLY